MRTRSRYHADAGSTVRNAVCLDVARHLRRFATDVFWNSVDIPQIQKASGEAHPETARVSFHGAT